MLAALLRQGLVPRFAATTLRRPRAAPYARTATVDFTVRGLRVKTVETEAELAAVLALRRDVFHREFAGRRVVLTSDRSGYDEVADHLAIFDGGTAVGVYRLIQTHRHDAYYSASEYDLAHLLAAPGKKLELSRACVARSHRNGVVMTLLWRGLGAYAAAAGAALRDVGRRWRPGTSRTCAPTSTPPG